jgi:predicted nucleotidyltransferase
MDWKTKRIIDILGMPKLNTDLMPPHVVIALKERAAKIEGIGAVILYGSIVRGEASLKSDIDVMVVPVRKKSIKILKKRLVKILDEIEDDYKLKVSFSLMIPSGKEDPYFMWETLKDGVVVFVRPEMAVQSIASLKPYALVSYSYTGLKENAKKKVQRFLFESKKGLQIDKHNKMEYIAPGVMVLPQERSKHVTEFFDGMHLQYSLMKIWR